MADKHRAPKVTRRRQGPPPKVVDTLREFFRRDKRYVSFLFSEYGIDLYRFVKGDSIPLKRFEILCYMFGFELVRTDAAVMASPPRAPQAPYEFKSIDEEGNLV